MKVSSGTATVATLLLFILVTLQSVALINAGASLQAHALFTALLLSLVVSIFFVPTRSNAPRALNPMKFLALGFLLGYWLPPILVEVVGWENNYLFSFHPDDCVEPLAIIIVSFWSMVVGALLFNIPQTSQKNITQILAYKPSLFSRNAFLIFYASVIFTKAWLLSRGYSGSLYGFLEKPLEPRYASVLRVIGELSPICFAFMVFIAHRFRGYIFLTGLIFTCEVAIHWAQGDRRDILLFVAPLVIIRMYFRGGRISPRTLIITGTLLAVAFGASSAINRSIDQSAGDQNFSYFQSAYRGLSSFLATPVDYYDGSWYIFFSFSQIQLVDAAIRAHEQGYQYAESPSMTYLLMLVPGANSLNLSHGSPASLQQPMYERALSYESIPNLTNPIMGETFVHGGISYVAAISALMGFTMMLLFWASGKSLPLWLAYQAFFIELTIGMGSSPSGKVFYLKIFILLAAINLLKTFVKTSSSSGRASQNIRHVERGRLC